MHIVKLRPKAGIVMSEKRSTSIARQWLGKHFSAATNTHRRKDVLLEAVISIRCARSYTGRIKVVEALRHLPRGDLVWRRGRISPP
jgi:hypothetical protein